VSSNRRDFLKNSAVIGGAIGMGLGAPSALGAAVPHVAPRNSDRDTDVDPYAGVERAQKPLRILILGGTGFTGPWQVRYAVARGHKVTLFNRGKSNPGLFPNVEQLVGDRGVADPKTPTVIPAGDYSALKGREWDVVIDVPTWRPRWSREAAAALKGRTKQYIFVSTISVYAANDTPGADETAALGTMEDPTVEDMRFYGPLKALSEKEVEKVFPGKTTIIRPGLIIGPGDTTDRFTYWPVRIRAGGEVMAPGTPTDPVQVIDARDIAEFIIRCAENGTVGTYNTTGPQSTLTIGEMLGGIRGAVSTDAHLTWVDAPFLQDNKVRQWTDMPVWINPAGPSIGFHRRSIAAALSKGLTFRPLALTTKDTLDYYDSEPEDRKAKLRAGLDPAREKELLAAWHAKQKA
jgi:2'-hydroxyisoflavone reductase